MVPTRADYLLADDLVFLNHGSFGATPRTVMDAYQALQIEMERNPVAWLGRGADELMAAARCRLGEYVGADGDDVVFFPNPTTAMNMVVKSLPLGPGDTVVTTDHEYGAMDRTWRKYCAERGASVVRASVPLPVPSAEEFVETVWSAVDERTRVLFLSHLTSATALVFPVAELCRRARAAGILAIVDGAHVPGHVPLDLATLDCDVYTGALHKWVSAPKGCSFLWVRREVQPTLQPLVTSWGWESDAPSAAPFVDLHEWQGTRDLSPFLAVSAALDFIATHDWERVRADAHSRALEARRRIDELTGLSPITPDGPDANGHEWIGQMVAVRLPDDVDVTTMQRSLYADDRIEVPVHRWSGQPFIRVSCAAHTTDGDIDALVEALTRRLRR